MASTSLPSVRPCSFLRLLCASAPLCEISFRWLLAVMCFGFAARLSAQDVRLPLPLDGRDGRNLLLENFRPKSMLKVPVHHLSRARFPIIDVHTHFRHKFHGSAE